MKKIFFCASFILTFMTAYTQITNELWSTSEHAGPHGIGSIIKMNTDGTGSSNVFDFTSPYPGINPFNLTEASNGKLYGTTRDGGAYGKGVLYSFDPTSGTYEKLNDFNSGGSLNTNGGSFPGNLMEASNGKLYGVTYKGGLNDLGILFSFEPSSHTYTVIFNFDDVHGTGPSGNLVQALNGKIYGTTDEGGLNNAGVLFSLDPSSNIVTKLFDFGGTAGINMRAGGYIGHPGTLVVASTGILYGTTISGGANNSGVLFQFDPTSNVYNKLYDFNSTNGQVPNGKIIMASDGKLYGKTQLGGVNNAGVFYRFDPILNTYNKLFESYATSIYTDGNLLTGLMEAVGGKLYGIANNAGNGTGGLGVLFCYDISTSLYNTLHNFTSNVSGQLTQHGNGKIYGTADEALFCFDPSTSNYTELFSGTYRYVIQSSSGNLYGVTTSELFSLDPSTSTYLTPVIFNSCPNGALPRGLLLPANDGKLYGVTVTGGTSNAGVLYSFDPATDSYQDLHDFDIVNGRLPVSGLTQATNGKLYGMTVSGGNNGGAYPFNGGIIYSYDPATSSFSNLFDFVFDYYSPNSTGNYPSGSLLQASNGMLYGMTESGGVNPGLNGFGGGVIFKFDPTTNVYTKIFDFGGVFGENPWSDLMQASDGKLYGMTSTGGIDTVNGLGAGVLFSLDPASETFTKLYDFKRDGTGYSPGGNLVEAPDGKLYGTTFVTNPHESGNGVIFNFDPTTNTYTKVYDFDGINGANPYGKLILGSDGKIYGKTNVAIFSFDPSSNTYTKLDNNIIPPGPNFKTGTNINHINNSQGPIGGGQNTITSEPSQNNDKAGGVLEVPVTGIIAKTITHTICPGPVFSVSFIVGYSSIFNSGNVFKAQLSDASGSFVSPSDIGTLTSTTTGVIEASIPLGTPTGSGYRIRVISTNPAMVGIDNGIDLVIGVPIISANSSTTFCPGGSVVLTATTGNSYLWSTGATTQMISANSAGAYNVSVGGCGTSAPITIEIPIATITNQPVSQTVSAGVSATFNVAATGTGLTYQWKKGITNLINGTRISGATSNTLFIGYVSAADASALYKCIITSSSGCSISTANTSLTVLNAAPVISSQPVLPSSFPCVSGSVSFTVGATGSGLTYHWYKGLNQLTNGGNITGATTATLTISSLSSNDNADYSVVVTNSLGSATSNTVNLLVNASTVINSQPMASQLVCPNGTVSLTVGASGSGITYRWRKGTIVLSDMTNSSGSVISGSHTPTLTISNSKSTDAAANYNCQLIGACNTVYTSNAAISVGALATPGSIIVSGGNAKVCPGDVRTYTVPAVSGATIYNWIIPTGASITSGSGTRIVSITFNSGFTYSGILSVSAGNSCGNSAARTLTIIRNTPAIPAGIVGATTACAGTSGNYSVTNVNGITYVWTAPANATITNGQGTNAITVNFSGAFTSGSLIVSATNSCGTSAPKVLAILSKPSTPSNITGLTGGACPGSSRNYTVTNVNGLTFNWTPPVNASIASGQGTNSVTVNFSGNFQSGSLSVTSNNSCGASAVRTLAITSVPSIPGSISGTIYGNCNATRTYSIPAVTSATSYTWTCTAPGAVLTPSGTSVTIAFSSFISGSVRVTANNACGSSAMRTLTVYGTPIAPPAISGSSTACVNQMGAPYSIASVASASSYTWTAPAGSSISDGSTSSSGNSLVTASTSVNVNFGSSPGMISVKASNTCGFGPIRNFSVSFNCRELNSESVSDMVISPNPAHNYVTLMYSAASGSTLLISLLDVTGRLVLEKSGVSTEGSNNYVLSLDNISHGLYTITIVSGDYRYQNKLIVE